MWLGGGGGGDMYQNFITRKLMTLIEENLHRVLLLLLLLLLLSLSLSLSLPLSLSLFLPLSLPAPSLCVIVVLQSKLPNCQRLKDHGYYELPG